MAKKKIRNSSSDPNKAIASIGAELNPRGNWKEHLMIASVLGGGFLLVVLGVWLAFATGVIPEPPSGSAPAPAPVSAP